MKIFDCPCFDCRKSFYGKAKIIETGNGIKYLQSYNTIVASIDGNGKFRRFWSGESMTTIRHINSFLALYGIPGGGLKWYREQAIVPYDGKISA